MKGLASTPLPNPEKQNEEQMKLLKPAWEKQERRLIMTGVDLKELQDLKDQPDKQIAEVAKAMGQREFD